jgi:hypothetical protein
MFFLSQRPARRWAESICHSLDSWRHEDVTDDGPRAAHGEPTGRAGADGTGVGRAGVSVEGGGMFLVAEVGVAH